MKEIEQAVQGLIARHVTRLATRTWVAVGLAAACVGALIWRLSAMRVERTWLLGIGAAAVVGLATWIAFARRAHRRLASSAPADIDRRLGLEARLLTAFEFANTASPPPLYEALVTDIRVALDQANRQLPRPVDARAAALGVLLLALLLWPGSRSVVQLAKTTPPSMDGAAARDESRAQQPGQPSAQGQQPGASQQPPRSGGQPQSQSQSGQGGGSSAGQQSPSSGGASTSSPGAQQQAQQESSGISQAGQYASLPSSQPGGNQPSRPVQPVPSSAGNHTPPTANQQTSGPQQSAGQPQQPSRPQASGQQQPNQQQQSHQQQNAQQASGSQRSGAQQQAGGSQQGSAQQKAAGSQQSGQQQQPRADGASGAGGKEPHGGAGSGDALKQDIQQLLKEMSGDLKQLQAQLAAQQRDQPGAGAGTATDPQLFDPNTGLERLSGEGARTPVQLSTDSQTTSKTRAGAGAGEASDDIGADAPHAQDEAAALSNQRVEESGGPRQQIPAEYRGVFERLSQPDRR